MNFIRLIILAPILLNISCAAERLMKRQDSDPSPKLINVASLLPQHNISKFQSNYERSLKDPTYDGYYLLRGYNIQRITDHLIKISKTSHYEQCLYYLTLGACGCLQVEVRGVADIAKREGLPSIILRIENK